MYSKQQQIEVIIQIMQLCKQCQSLPPVTICIKGKLCFKCGNKCHGQYQHPVQFIRHCSQSNNLSKKTTKSQSIITASKSLKQLPKRLTKINSKLALTNMKYSNVKTKKATESSKFTHQDKQNIRMHLNSVTVVQKHKDQVLQLSKRSIGMMAQDNQVEQSEQIINLKRKLKKQDQIINLLYQKLKRQKQQKHQLKKSYQGKLKFIRQLRQ